MWKGRQLDLRGQEWTGLEMGLEDKNEATGSDPWTWKGQLCGEPLPMLWLGSEERWEDCDSGTGQ